MLCVKGKQTKLPGETGLFFICQSGKNPGNQCRFVKLCKQTGHYIMSTNKAGQTCEDYVASDNIDDFYL